jgi:hypothetical protein
MAMLQMLSEMIRPKEFLRVIAFSKLMHIHQMLNPRLPISVGGDLAF